MQFDGDLIACAEAVQKGDPDRFLAAMAAPVEARPLLFALYAFNIEMSRAPWASQESMIAEMRVQWWRDVGAEIASGGQVRRHYVATPLARLVNHEAAQVIDAMAEARRWDIYRDPFEDEAAFDTFIDATSGGLMWMAAASLGPADEGVVRDYAYAAGLAAYLRAIPELEAQKRVPLLDGTNAGLIQLAERGLDRLAAARRGRQAISSAASSALLPGWQAGAILRQVRAEPARVAAGALGLSEFRRRVSPPASTKKGAMAILTAAQPSTGLPPEQFISPPDATEATVTPPKTSRSLRPCIRPRSCASCAPASMVVAPIKPKFQPTPRRISAIKKLPRSTPCKATAPAPARITSPAPTTFSTPKRAIRCPVKNDGTYIARTCEVTTSAAVFWLNPQPTTANGVDVITRFISA